jgi:hypothetical protein
MMAYQVDEGWDVAGSDASSAHRQLYACVPGSSLSAFGPVSSPENFHAASI